MKPASYWNKRMEILEQSRYDGNVQSYHEIENIYRKQMAEMQKEINAWYARFAKNNEIDLADARKLLDAKELEELKWNVEDYIKYGTENALDPKWIKQLENASARYHISRLEALQLQIQQRAESVMAAEQDVVDQRVREVYSENYYHTAFEIQRGIGVGWDLERLDERRIDNVISKPWAVDGKNFSERIWEQRDKLVNTLHQELTQSIIRGEDPERAVKTLAERMSVSQSNARRLIMTESAAMASAAQKECYKELDVEQYKIVATLDDLTCDVCAGLDGQVFKMSEYNVGTTAPPFHPNCYDKETEVLTKRGWVHFKDLNESDLVYTINKETLIPEWQKPLKYISYKYNGELIHFKNDRTDIMVTPNHNMLVQNMDSSVKDKSFKLRVAQSIGTKSKNRMIGGCNWIGEHVDSIEFGGKTVPIELYLKFMAFWLADGSIQTSDDYHVRIAQCNNQWMYDELKDLPFGVHKYEECLIIYDKTLRDELAQYGKSNEKYVPEIIKTLSPNLIRVFLNAYSLTDGFIKSGKILDGYQCKDSISFFTTSNQIAADLGELIIKAGGRVSYSLQKQAGKEQQFKNGMYTMNYDLWIVNWNKQQYSWVCNMDVVNVSYDDFVYCVEVEKHNTLFVRRNGKTIWCGNCRTVTVPYFADDADSKRAARGADGKTYLVPADTKYNEWKKAFVDGEEKPFKVDPDWKPKEPEPQPEPIELKYTFVEAKTIEEAQEFAKQFIGDGYAPHFKNDVNFKGISIEHANEINRALTDAFNRFDLPKLNGITTVSPTSAIGKKAFKDGADAVFSYSPAEGGIYINKEIVKNAKSFETYVKRSEDAWQTVIDNIDKLKGSDKEKALIYKNAGRDLVDGKTIKGMFTHELGHHVQWQMLKPNEINDIGSRKSQFAPNISGYANASQGEYFAESFAAYAKGERNNLDPKFVKLLDSKKNVLNNVNTANMFDGTKRKSVPENASEVRQELIKLKVDALPYEEHKKSLTTEEIVDRIGGGDMTKGSCASVAFAYVGNKAGFDVLDFRDGESRNTFSLVGNIRKIAKLDGVISFVEYDTNNFKAVGRLIQQMKIGKEYYLSTGKHAAIVRKVGDDLSFHFEYLELQSPNDNGFKRLTNSVLKDRFDCKKSHTTAGLKLDLPNILIDVESLGDNAEFQALLEYINTNVAEQKKGENGSAK